MLIKCFAHIWKNPLNVKVSNLMEISWAVNEHRRKKRYEAINAGTLVIVGD